MHKFIAGVAAVALLAFAGAASAVEVAGSTASSQVASQSGAVTLGPGSAFGVTAATNTSVSGAAANSGGFFGPTTSVTATNSTGATTNFHTQTGFSIGGSTSAQQGSATAFGFAFSPF